MWLRSDCRYCAESLEFYKRLLAAPHRARTVIMGLEPQESLEAYANKSGLAVDRVLSVPRDGVLLSGTPSLVEVRADQTIAHVWVGKLAAAQELEVSREIR